MSNEEQIYYKVVHVRESGEYESVWVYRKGLRTIYPFNKWVSGKYPLFIFDTLHNATKFCCFSSGETVFKCKAENARKLDGPVVEISRASLSEINSYWLGDLTDVPLAPQVYGTLIADAVMLIEECYGE